MLVVLECGCVDEHARIHSSPDDCDDAIVDVCIADNDDTGV
jgi:hypothetical protein